MNKEELEKEAEEYALNQWEGNLPWSVIQKSYYDGALPREKQIRIDAEQIRALQKQNGELTDELTKKSDTNHQLVEQLAKLNERCFDLEKENAELKMKRKAERKIFQGIVEKKNDQLTKAKDLLKRCYENYIYLEPLRSEIEQFISEVEK